MPSAAERRAQQAVAEVETQVKQTLKQKAEARAKELHTAALERSNKFLAGEAGKLNGRQLSATLFPAALGAVAGAKLQGYIAKSTVNRVEYADDKVTVKDTPLRTILAHVLLPVVGTVAAWQSYKRVGVKRGYLMYGAVLVGGFAGLAIGSVVNSIQVPVERGTPPAPEGVVV